jgi:exonuclease III
MKIVSWNCKAISPYDKEGFTEKKAGYIEKYNADIYVIQECTAYDIEKLKNFKKHNVWYGDNIDSKDGIGIFSDMYNIKLLE